MKSSQPILQQRWWFLLVGIVLVGGTLKIEPLLAVSVPRLSAVGVEVNGKTAQEVPRGQVLELIRGDRLRLLYATLQNSSRSPDLINFVGFWRANVARKGDDRELTIDTSRLKKEWSLDKEGRDYRVEALTKGASHGDIKVRIVEPTLHSLELEINKEVRTVQAGQVLELRGSDQIQLRSLHTNHPRLDKEARVQFIELGAVEGIRKVEIEVTHQDLTFAKVSLLVKP